MIDKSITFKNGNPSQNTPLGAGFKGWGGEGEFPETLLTFLYCTVREIGDGVGENITAYEKQRIPVERMRNRVVEKPI